MPENIYVGNVPKYVLGFNLTLPNGCRSDKNEGLPKNADPSYDIGRLANCMDTYVF